MFGLEWGGQSCDDGLWPTRSVVSRPVSRAICAQVSPYSRVEACCVSCACGVVCTVLCCVVCLGSSSVCLWRINHCVIGISQFSQRSTPINSAGPCFEPPASSSQPDTPRARHDTSDGKARQQGCSNAGLLARRCSPGDHRGLRRSRFNRLSSPRRPSWLRGREGPRVHLQGHAAAAPSAAASRGRSGSHRHAALISSPMARRAAV